MKDDTKEAQEGAEAAKALTPLLIEARARFHKTGSVAWLYGFLMAIFGMVAGSIGFSATVHLLESLLTVVKERQQAYRKEEGTFHA